MTALSQGGRPGAQDGVTRIRTSPSVSIDATEFMDLTRRFRVTGVPKTIVNGTIEILGALPEEQFVRAALQICLTKPPRTR